MKVYSTQNFIKKAQYSDLPGDPNYPPGVRPGDTDAGFGSPGTPVNLKETIDIQIPRDWDDYKQWYAIDNKTGLLAGKTGISIIDVNLTFIVQGYVEDPENLDINFKVNHISSDTGEDITVYELNEGEEDIVKEKLKEVVSQLI